MKALRHVVNRARVLLEPNKNASTQQLTAQSGDIRVATKLELIKKYGMVRNGSSSDDDWVKDLTPRGGRNRGVEQAKRKAQVLEMDGIPLLLGNDFLRHFKKLGIHYDGKIPKLFLGEFSQK